MSRSGSTNQNAERQPREERERGQRTGQARPLAVTCGHRRGGGAVMAPGHGDATGAVRVAHDAAGGRAPAARCRRIRSALGDQNSSAVAIAS